MPTDIANWVGQVLDGGRYQVVAQLGEGGMGFVYRAHDRRLDTEVVVKVPRRSLLEDPEFSARFAREIRALVQLNHPGIVRVLDVGLHDNLPYAVMAFLRGGNLSQRRLAVAGQPLPQKLAALSQWLPPVAEALDYIHQRKYVHRDIKPDNILFDELGHAFVGDFGVVKLLFEQHERKKQTFLTAAGVVLGTPQFMAPELVQGMHYDGKVDQYALAVTVYQFLTGACPFEAPSAGAIFALQITTPPPNLRSVLPDIASGPAQAVMLALAKQPQDRFPTCREFAQAMAESGKPGNLSIQAGPPPLPIAPPTAEPLLVKLTCPGCGRQAGVPQGPILQKLQCPFCKLQFEQGKKKPPAVVAPPVPQSETPTGVQRGTKKIPKGPLGLKPVVFIAAALGIFVLGVLLTLVILNGNVGKPIDSAGKGKDRDGKKTAGESEKKPFTNSIGMKFVWIRPGTFRMGSPQDEKERHDDEILHRVTLSKGFYMAIYPVTQAQWKAVTGDNPSQFKRADLPVDNVSWNDCQEFIKELREIDKKPYRLPTEAEWEYACRAGTTTPFYFGETISTDQANYDGNYTYGNGRTGVFREKTTPVGSFPANAWGLHDMHGNVRQWCEDRYGDYPKNDVVDPQGPDAGGRRVLRGGSWYHEPIACRSASRDSAAAGEHNERIGFRLCFCLD